MSSKKFYVDEVGCPVYVGKGQEDRVNKHISID